MPFSYKILPDFNIYVLSYQNLIMDYLQKLSYAIELMIIQWFTEVMFMMKLDKVILPELRFACLTIQMQVTKFKLYGISRILKTSLLL